MLHHTQYQTHQQHYNTHDKRKKTDGTGTRYTKNNTWTALCNLTVPPSPPPPLTPRSYARAHGLLACKRYVNRGLVHLKMILKRRHHVITTERQGNSSVAYVKRRRTEAFLRVHPLVACDCFSPSPPQPSQRLATDSQEVSKRQNCISHPQTKHNAPDD